MICISAEYTRCNGAPRPVQLNSNLIKAPGECRRRGEVSFQRGWNPERATTPASRWYAYIRTLAGCVSFRETNQSLFPCKSDRNVAIRCPTTDGWLNGEGEKIPLTRRGNLSFRVRRGVPMRPSQWKSSALKFRMGTNS